MTGPQLAFTILFLLFMAGAIVCYYVQEEKEAARKRWHEHFKNKPWNDPARIKLARAGYPVY